MVATLRREQVGVNRILTRKEFMDSLRRGSSHFETTGQNGTGLRRAYRNIQKVEVAAKVAQRVRTAVKATIVEKEIGEKALV